LVQRRKPSAHLGRGAPLDHSPGGVPESLAPSSDCSSRELSASTQVLNRLRAISQNWLIRSRSKGSPSEYTVRYYRPRRLVSAARLNRTLRFMNCSASSKQLFAHHPSALRRHGPKPPFGPSALWPRMQACRRLAGRFRVGGIKPLAACLRQPSRHCSIFRRKCSLPSGHRRKSMVPAKDFGESFNG
jgi:hypothetical protein